MGSLCAEEEWGEKPNNRNMHGDDMSLPQSRLEHTLLPFDPASAGKALRVPQGGGGPVLARLEVLGW